jgi:hypothetical protein
LSFFIECSLGYYGYNSNESCDGCLSDACDRESGICINTSGCNPGRHPGHEKYDLGVVESNNCKHEIAYGVHKKWTRCGHGLWTDVVNNTDCFSGKLSLWNVNHKTPVLMEYISSLHTNRWGKKQHILLYKVYKTKHA